MRYWMAPEGTGSGIVHSRLDNDEPIWAGKPGREVIPVVVGSKAWAVIQAMEGRRVTHPDGLGEPWEARTIAEEGLRPDGWYLLPPSPPPLRRGERVKGFDGPEEWEGSYWGPGCTGGHWMGRSGPSLWVERVERVERIEGGAG